MVAAPVLGSAIAPKRPMRRNLRWVWAIGLLTGQAAFAQPVPESTPVREDRPFSLGVSPTWPWMAENDVTLPVLPTVRLSVNVSPRVSVDLTAGIFSYEGSGQASLLDIGARWFFSEGHASPYLMVRASEYWDAPNEGREGNYPYAAAGAGLEYACGCGLALWGEIGPAVLGYDQEGPRTWNRGVYVNLGLGYRFRLRSHP